MKSASCSSMATLWLLGLFLVGCAGTPEIRYFTLDTADEIAADPSTKLYISRVQVPDYLDDNRLWVRPEPHRLEALPYVRWAEHLPRAITRGLQLRLGAGISEPTDGHRVLVDVYRFEANWGDGERPDRMILTAGWRIENGAGREQLRLEKPVPDRDAATLVAIKAELVTELSKRIAGSAN